MLYLKKKYIRNNREKKIINQLALQKNCKNSHKIIDSYTICLKYITGVPRDYSNNSEIITL